MLPGFRFLFAAILLSTSILVFGLGAAALLRATHQEYVNNPSWRNGPQEQVFAQAPEPAQPVLAALRVDQPPEEPAPTLRDQVPSVGLPAVEIIPEQMAAVTLDAKPEIQLAAVAPTADPVAPVSEPTAREPATPEALAPADTPKPDDNTTASIVGRTPTPTMSATEVPRTATPALASRVNDLAAARMAALNDLDQAKPKAVVAPPKSKPRAQKKKRHRVVRRPPPQPVTQALDPFGQPTLAATAAAGAR